MPAQYDSIKQALIAMFKMSSTPIDPIQLLVQMDAQHSRAIVVSCFIEALMEGSLEFSPGTTVQANQEDPTVRDYLGLPDDDDDGDEPLIIGDLFAAIFGGALAAADPKESARPQPGTFAAILRDIGKAEASRIDREKPTPAAPNESDKTQPDGFFDQPKMTSFADFLNSILEGIVAEDGAPAEPALKIGDMVRIKPYEPSEISHLRVARVQAIFDNQALIFFPPDENDAGGLARAYVNQLTIVKKAPADA